jgi:hypothetical protein
VTVARISGAVHGRHRTCTTSRDKKAPRHEPSWGLRGVLDLHAGGELDRERIAGDEPLGDRSRDRLLVLGVVRDQTGGDRADGQRHRGGQPHTDT